MEQELKIKEEILDQFVFCQAIREADGIQIAVDQQLSSANLRYRMKRGGEITGFDQVTKPYGLRYGAAKAFNDSCKLSPGTSLHLSQSLMGAWTGSGCDE